MSTKRIDSVANLDECGEPEIFTFDLFPIVPDLLTVHLNEHGVPKIGTQIMPGMIIIGKIGKTRLFDSTVRPTCLEKHGLSFEELQARYGHMWYNVSRYATQDDVGIVTKADCEEANSVSSVSVWIELD